MVTLIDFVGQEKAQGPLQERKLEPWLDKITCMDALEGLKQLPHLCVDLTVTSPPYDDLRHYNGYSFDFEGIARELFRVTKRGGVAVWVIGDATVNGSETGTSFKQALYFLELGFNLHDTMIYEKAGFSNPSNTRYHQSFEYMFVFLKGKLKTFNPIEDRKVKYDGPWGKNTKRQKDGTLKEMPSYKNNKVGRRYNIWRYSIGRGNSTKDDIAFEHPAIFPEDLAKDHILSWSDIGDVVLDPMCGSGTTCKMAKWLQRRYIGIDISEEYCKIAEKRLRKTFPLPLESLRSKQSELKLEEKRLIPLLEQIKINNFLDSTIFKRE